MADRPLTCYTGLESELSDLEIRATTILTDRSSFSNLDNLDHAWNAHREMPSYFQAFDGGVPIGSLSVFSPESDTGEISAYVPESRRRQGIFRALLAEAVGAMEPYGYRRLLFPCDARSQAGQAAAKHWGLTLDHAEYLMAYGGRRPPANLLPELRAAGEDDVGPLVQLNTAVFGGDPADVEHNLRDSLAHPSVLCLTAWQDGELLGTASANLGGESLCIFGVAVSPAHQGRGWGRAILAALLDDLTARTLGKQITLEVDSTNGRAFRLYTTSGFSIVRQVDYYAAALPEVQARCAR